MDFLCQGYQRTTNSKMFLDKHLIQGCSSFDKLVLMFGVSIKVFVIIQDISIDGGQTKIPENEKLFIIGALQTTDEDVGDTFTYHVISYWKIFRIRGDKLEVRTPLDFEKKSSYTVTIKSTDDGGLSFSKSFNFRVLNINEKPSNISLNPREVRI